MIMIMKLHNTSRILNEAEAPFVQPPPTLEMYNFLDAPLGSCLWVTNGLSIDVGKYIVSARMSDGLH